MNLIVNMGRVAIMRQIGDWLAKHATLPIDSVAIQLDGSVTMQPWSRQPDGDYDYRSQAEIHNLYTIAEAVGAEVELTDREYGLGWYLTVTWRIGQIPVESQILVSRMAIGVHEPELTVAIEQPELAAVGT